MLTAGGTCDRRRLLDRSFRSKRRMTGMDMLFLRPTSNASGGRVHLGIYANNGKDQQVDSNEKLPVWYNGKREWIPGRAVLACGRVECPEQHMTEQEPQLEVH